MSQKIHWTLLIGCLALSSMFAPMAARSLAVFRLPLQGAGGIELDLETHGESVLVAEVDFESAIVQPTGR